MTLGKEKDMRVSGYLRKAGMVLTAAAVAGMMCAPAALANSSGAGIVTGNGYGMNPSKEIGENTVPSAKKGDQPYNLTNLYNTSGQRYITGACGGTGTASCDYLDVVGIGNIGTTGYNWGTKINVNPNQFAWNDAVTDESTCTQVSGSATDAAAGIGYVKSAWQGVMTYATVEKYLPDVLAASGNSAKTYETIVTMVHNDAYEAYDPDTDTDKTRQVYTGDTETGVYEKATYNAEAEGVTYYQIKQDRVSTGFGPSATISYKDNANALKYAVYAPKIVDLSATGNLALTVLVDGVWSEAVAAESIEGYGDTAITRYDDPTTIAQDYEGFVKGLQWYILSKHEKQGTLKTVAYVSKYEDGQVSCMATNPESTQDGALAVRQYEGFEQIANNIALTGSTFQLSGTFTDNGSNTYVATSLDDFKNVDVVFTPSSFDSTALQSALDAAGCTCKIVPVNVAIGNQGFGLSRNLVEYMGYLYPEDVQLSYALKYFWSHFAHVKAEYVDAVMVDQDSNKLLPTGDAEIDLDTTGYNEYYIVSRMAEGEEYYFANENNADSNCSHYRLQAQTATMTANGATFVKGLFAKQAEELKPVAPAAKAQKVTASNVTKTFKAAKKTKKLAAKKTFKLKASAKTSLTFAKKSGNGKIAVSKAGKVTVKKGLKKGTYKVKVKITAKKTSAYKAATKTITVTVKVK